MICSIESFDKIRSSSYQSRLMLRMLLQKRNKNTRKLNRYDGEIIHAITAVSTLDTAVPS